MLDKKMTKGIEVINCVFDFTDSPYDVAIKMYIVDESSLLSRLKGWWIGMRLRKYINKIGK